jgi:flagellar biosynthesis protein FlhB
MIDCHSVSSLLKTAVVVKIFLEILVHLLQFLFAFWTTKLKPRLKQFNFFSCVKLMVGFMTVIGMMSDYYQNFHLIWYLV